MVLTGENPKYKEKKIFHCPFVHHKFHTYIGLGINMGV